MSRWLKKERRRVEGRESRFFDVRQSNKILLKREVLMLRDIELISFLSLFVFLFLKGKEICNDKCDRRSSSINREKRRKERRKGFSSKIDFLFILFQLVRCQFSFLIFYFASLMTGLLFVCFSFVSSPIIIGTHREKKVRLSLF